MATWGDFIKDVEVIRIGKKMYASIEQAIDLWEDRRKLRERLAELESELTSTRETCAQEVEEFARVCAEEGAAPEVTIQMLNAAAGMIRVSGEEIIDAEPVDDVAAAEPIGVAQAEPVHGANDVPEAQPVAQAEPIDDAVFEDDPIEDEEVPEAMPVAETYAGHAAGEEAVLEAQPVDGIPEAEPIPDGEHH